jgi:L-histidine N-alpha-methyltransferase
MRPHHHVAPRLTRLAPVADRREQLAYDVLAGLTRRDKQLPAKWLYDAAGSALFERITHLPEYYLTRAETEILAREAPRIVDAVRPAELVELGSGSSKKTRLLLDAMHASGTGERYAPLDVSEEALSAAAEALEADHRWLAVDSYVGDFHDDLPKIPRHGRRLLAFLGSTIGNLTPAERARLLRSVAAALAPGDRFLLGVDLVKDPAVLEAAYDDAAGVTAAFTRNVLRVLQRELHAGVDVDAFVHAARWDPANAWMDIGLRAVGPASIAFPTLDLEVDFAEGERLRTEISAKFTRWQVERELAAAGLRLDAWLTDAAVRFACAVSTPARR